MIARSFLTAVLVIAWVAPSVAGESSVLRFDNESEQTLAGRDARLQLLVSHIDGRITDSTHAVAYTTNPPGIVEVSSDGYVRPVADGHVVTE